MTSQYILDWLSLLGRWLHLIVGIAWIGASFYFVWLDNHLEPPPDPDDVARGVAGELWAVHGGGFYNPKKYRVAPEALPATLHWFKWEAYWTWMSGVFLLCVVYYAGADLYLIDKSVANLAAPAAIAIGVASIALGWIVYDVLCRSPLGQHPRALAAALSVYLIVAAWVLCHVFSGRGAYIHFGAMLGTIMVANVFFVIMPGQREMVAACSEGRTPDPAAAARAKQRSVHNTYITLPVLFTMISNHYAMAYGHAWNWVILLAFVFAGAAIRTYFVARHRPPASPVPAIAGVVTLLVVAVVIAPSSSPVNASGEAEQAQRVVAIVKQRCTSCHSAKPTQPGFVVAPKDVMFDTPGQMKLQAARILQQASTRAMPLGNLTNMTDEERALVVDWAGREAARTP